MTLQGRDDLRQDAVMQQVFGMVNNLLRKEKETRERKLSVRQYKVRTRRQQRRCDHCVISLIFFLPSLACYH